MSDAIYKNDRRENWLRVAAAGSYGEVRQLADGRAGVAVGQGTFAANDLVKFDDEGKHTLTKATSLVFTDGAPVYWDHSVNAVVLYPASDRDFFVGVCVDDAASADTTCVVDLNVKPHYKIEMGRNQEADIFDTVVVKTVVGSTTVEVPHLELWPGAARMVFGATAEAQKVDILSKQGFAVGSNWIVEGCFTVVDDGDAAAIDFNVGVANATHATDADAITESCFLHTDANVVNILAESDDGTTEVAATDTTIDYTLGTPVHFVIDGRNPADIQIYINGVLMLGSTVFVLTAATGPLKLLAHMEKTSDDETADYRINYLRVRTMEQD